MRRSLSILSALSLATVVLVGCGGDDADGGADPADAPTGDAEDVAEGIDVDGMVDAQESMQEAQGGGHATLTVGDQTWEFDSVLCAFGPSETGRDDTEFVLSSIQDGLQLDATINTEFGHSVSINDIEDFEDPSVSLSAGGPMSALTGDDESEIIIVDGKDVRAEASFFDDTSDTMDTVEGTLVATCP